MKNITKAIVKKVMVAVFAVMGVMATCAELTREDLRDDNGNVVGYKVAGLGNDEVPLVFTKAGKDITYTVPADIENVEYTVAENDGDDTKTWVTPKDGYYFFKGYIVR